MTRRCCMAWTMVGLGLLAAACQAAPKQDEPTDTVAPVETAGPTAETADTSMPAPTGETGTTAVDVWPLCDHVGRTENITLLGADRLDAAGSSVDAADIDGDGCAELAVAAPWEGDYQLGEGAVYLVTTDSLASGPLDEVATATWEEPDESGWVYRVALVPPQVAWLTAWSGPNDEGDLVGYKMLTFDLPQAPLSAIVGASELGGGVDNSRGFSSASNDIEDCSGLGTPTVCVGSASHGPELDFAGSIALYDMPLHETLSIPDFRTQVYGNDGEEAQMVEADDDLDGDGLADLVIGAFNASVTGRVGLVSAPAEGDFLLWDVAWATLEGVVEEGSAGIGLATGDLDGDGHVDVWVGAPIRDAGYAYVMTGPFAGDVSLSVAPYIVEGEASAPWAGYDGAIGDMDGDGAAELIVGAPHSYYFGTGPGVVGVFPSPTPGAYTVGQAPIQLTSGSPDPDAFGISIAPADFDGDGRMDLAIGAPNDLRAAPQAGSVTLVFGASL
jgi:hypothetical protein